MNQLRHQLGTNQSSILYFFSKDFHNSLVVYIVYIGLYILYSVLSKPRMKIFVFFIEISAIFRVSADGETKQEGEMSTAEISKNFAKNRRNFSEILVKKEISAIFLKNRLQKISEKYHFVSVYFGKFSPILLKKKNCTCNTSIDAERRR